MVLLLCSCNCIDGSPRGGANVGIGGGGGGGGGADVTVGDGPPTDERWRLWIEFWRKTGGFGLLGGSSYSVVSLLPSSSLEKDRLASENFRFLVIGTFPLNIIFYCRRKRLRYPEFCSGSLAVDAELTEYSLTTELGRLALRYNSLAAPQSPWL